MLPLKLLLAAPLLLPVADRKLAGCGAHKPFKTEVTINLDIPDTIYNYNMSTSQLTKGHEQVISDWQSKQEDRVWASNDLVVEGVTRGGMGVSSVSYFLGTPYDRYGMYYCPYVQKIVIDVHYNSRIFITSALKQGSCKFFAVLDHEHKHHNANVGVVKEVLKKLEGDLPEILKTIERRYVPKAEVQNGFDSLTASLDDALKVYSSYMYEIMEKRNGLIDTPKEYDRIDNECRAQK